MVAMARALMMEPAVLLLDEPSAGLSPVLAGRGVHPTQEDQPTGVTVVMVEQNARRCLQICDRGYVLDQGRNAYTGTGRELDERPQGHRALPRHARPAAVDAFSGLSGVIRRSVTPLGPLNAVPPVLEPVGK